MKHLQLYEGYVEQLTALKAEIHTASAERDRLLNAANLLAELRTRPEYQAFFEGSEMGFFLKEGFYSQRFLKEREHRKQNPKVDLPNFNIHFVDLEAGDLWDKQLNLRKALWLKLKKWGFKNFQPAKEHPLKATTNYWWADADQAILYTAPEDANWAWGPSDNPYPVIEAPDLLNMTEWATEIPAYAEAGEMGFFTKSI